MKGPSPSINSDTLQNQLLALFSELHISQMGHFQMESGFHSDLWLNLNTLLSQQKRLKPFVTELGRRFNRQAVDVVCGPQTGGAQLAEIIALQLNKVFCYSDRIVDQKISTVEYKIPQRFYDPISGKRIAIVDDVIQAGSAIRKTITDLEAHGAIIVTIGGLLTLGSPAKEYAKEKHITLENIAKRENKLWTPEECPLCTAHIPLDRAV